MRLLVTRPDDAAAHTIRRLRDLGHQIVTLPVMKAEHHLDATLKALRIPHGALAITSAAAVRALAAIGGHLDPYLGDRVYAVGEATAAAAREIGFRDVEAAFGTGDSMVELFGDRLAGLAAEKPLLYLAGNPRSPAFEEGLKQRNVPLIVVESYRMHPLPISEADLHSIIESGPIDGILLYSRETARHFFALPFAGSSRIALERARIFCLSDNVAKAVPEALHSNIATAAQPSEDSLLSLL